MAAVGEQTKVLTWRFEENGEARPLTSKKNAIISDGNSVAKITLHEAYTSKVFPGQSYITRGYSLRGESRPMALIL